MSKLNQELTLDKLSIPGTHDSGTAKTSKGAAHTQNFGIYQQLIDGIRFLDIRVKASKNDKDPLDIYHGLISCQISLGDVLDDCVNFLNENTDETIIMLMNEANDKGEKTQEQLDYYLQNESYKSIFYLDSKLPKLKDVRGKVVLLRRFPGNTGIDLSSGWKVNETFTLETPEKQVFHIQDEYKQHDTHKKISSVESLINIASSNPDDGIMYINYNSISQGGHTPYQYAWGGGIGKVDPMMNPGLEKFLDQEIEKLKPENKTPRLGVIMLDFYNNKKGNIDNSNVVSIIKSNENIALIEG